MASSPRSSLMQDEDYDELPMVIPDASSAPLPQGHLYPLAGITFFIKNPSLWGVVLCSVICGIIVAVIVIVLSFMFLFPPQAVFLVKVLPEKVDYWLGPTLAVILTLIESSILAIVIVALSFDRIEEKLFEKTLAIRGALPRDTRARVCGCPVPRVPLLSKCVNECRGFCVSPGDVGYGLAFVGIDLLLLPLNLIPAIGSMVYMLIAGALYAFHIQRPWFSKYKRLRPAEQLELFWYNLYPYGTFGLIGTGLLAFPIVNIFFIFTNYVGAALWFADISLGQVRMLGRVGAALVGVEPPRRETDDDGTELPLSNQTGIVDPLSVVSGVFAHAMVATQTGPALTNLQIGGHPVAVTPDHAAS